MSKEIKYAQIDLGGKFIEQVLGCSLVGRPKVFTHQQSKLKERDYETIKKIRWETSDDGKHTDLVIETDYSIVSYNSRYVISWGIF